MSFVIAVDSSVDLRTFSQKRVVRVSLKNKNHEKKTKHHQKCKSQQLQATSVLMFLTNQKILAQISKQNHYVDMMKFGINVFKVTIKTPQRLSLMSL